MEFSQAFGDMACPRTVDKDMQNSSMADRIGTYMDLQLLVYQGTVSLLRWRA